ncbi:hypothetical protein L195_g029381 [Trifolium pratense]|uniref:Uncharacterized protein n=1 Tax=Trifolium pratense TaxID=57577 RepID=A0A2K3L4N8_TRIPR|nr:hypothetical protein L195_g029381 [Trifolium pratense]
MNSPLYHDPYRYHDPTIISVHTLFKVETTTILSVSSLVRNDDASYCQSLGVGNHFLLPHHCRLDEGVNDCVCILRVVWGDGGTNECPRLCGIMNSIAYGVTFSLFMCLSRGAATSLAFASVANVASDDVCCCT